GSGGGVRAGRRGGSHYPGARGAVSEINEKTGVRPGRRIVANQDVLEAVTRAGVAPNRLAGFAFVRAPRAPGTTLRTEATAIADAFAGPYGGATRAAALSGAAWSGTLPGPEQILSTWSDHQEARGACVLEGELYSEAFGGRPERGEDPQLARRLFEA